ncbi:hypothetical protein KSP39_PZI011133 [Platanthera zijinensis]|uniref:Uncharacterized protein n=1 Tax=Platanthera zijinensis TaxID=2320716 RepID=A0AAP0BGD8_9ASPA
MPLSKDGETLAPAPAPASELRSSFRRRLISGAAAAAAAVAPDASVQMTSAENYVTESMGGDTCSDADSTCMDGRRNGGAEKRMGKAAVNNGGGKREMGRVRDEESRSCRQRMFFGLPHRRIGELRRAR